jgi:hypothetical protein
MFGSSGGSKPHFASWQKAGDAASNIDKVFREIIGARLFGGAPDVGAEQAGRRARQGTRRQFAQRGMTGSGLEARAMGEAQIKSGQAGEAQLMDLVRMAIAPAGQVTGGGFKIGLSA